MKIPVFLGTINKEKGLDTISLVDLPAIEVNYTTLQKNNNQVFIKLNKELGVLAGPVLIPEKLIYREDETTGAPYYLQFNAESIKEIQQDWNKKPEKLFNVMHTKDIAPCLMLSSHIVDDPATDLSTTQYGFDLPAGSWFALVKVTEPDFWESKIATGELKGFSIEGNLGLQLDDVAQLKLQNFNTLDMSTKPTPPADTEVSENMIERAIAKFMTLFAKTQKQARLRAVQLSTGHTVMVDDQEQKAYLGEQEIPAGIPLALADGTFLFAAPKPGNGGTLKTKQPAKQATIKLMKFTLDDDQGELEIGSGMEAKIGDEPIETGEYWGTAENGDYYHLVCEDGVLKTLEREDKETLASEEVKEMMRTMQKMKLQMEAQAKEIAKLKGEPQVSLGQRISQRSRSTTPKVETGKNEAKGFNVDSMLTTLAEKNAKIIARNGSQVNAITYLRQLGILEEGSNN